MLSRSRSRVILDYLSFTTRPDLTDAHEFIADLDKRYLKGLEGPPAFLLSQPLEFYKSLTKSGKLKFDKTLGNMAVDILADLQAFIPFLEGRNRDFGYSGYTSSMELHRDGQPAGLIAWGGRNAGVYVSLSGTGVAGVCSTIFHKMLQQFTRVKLTRVDLAFDSFDGTYNYDWCETQFIEGGFNAGGRAPKCGSHHSGGSVVDGDIKYSGGRTFTVGNRANGKFFRGYEKGRQLIGQGVTVGDSTKDWFRLEVEIHSTKRNIPLEILSRPTDFMAGMYPCLGFISSVKEKVKIKKQVAKITLEQLKGHARNSYGNLVSFLSVDLEYTDSEIVKLLKSRVHRPPRRLTRLVGANFA